jgi:hypothetical protein
MAILIAMIARWAHPELHSKPLDATIGRVPAPYRPGNRHGQRIQIKHTKH